MARKHAPQRDPSAGNLGDADTDRANRGAVAVHQTPAVSTANTSAGEGAEGRSDYLQILIERLRAGRVVLVAGAALGSGRPTWRGRVEALLNELAKQPGSEAEVQEARGLVGGYPLSVCGFVRRRLGDHFGAALAAAVPTPDSLPEAVERAAKLPFRALLTTGIDDSLVRACQSSQPDIRIYRADQAEEVRRDGRGRYVLRLLGGADDPANVLFSESDLRRVLADDGFRALVGELYAKRSFLFIGFDPADPDFGIVVDRVLVGAKAPVVTAGQEPAHFALFTGVPRVVQEEIEASYGIRALPTEQFPEELSLLRALSEALGGHTGEFLPDEDDLEGWLRVLQQEPNRTDAVDALAAIERRLDERGDADRLIELWLGRTEVETTPAGRARCLRCVAEVFEHKKGQMAEAFQSALAAFREVPELSYLDDLERLAGISGGWVDLLGALRELMPSLPAAAQPELWLRIARLYGEKLNHVDYALASLAEAQKLDIRDAGLRRRLLDARVELNRRAERWKDLAEALGLLAADLGGEGGEKDRQIDLYLEQGELYETRLSDGISAIAAFKKARATAPESRDVLSALEHSLRRHSSWTDLIAVLDEKCPTLEATGTEADAAAALECRREAARLCTEHQNDRKAAVARWEALRKLAPTDVETLRALEKLHAHDGGASEQYLQVVSALADNVPSEKERLSLYRRLYAEYEDLPGHAAQAAECLEKILKIDTTAEDAYRGLERLYGKDKNWTALIATYERHIERSEGGKVELLAALARVYEQDLPAGDAEVLRTQAPLAVKAWLRILELQPDHLGALDALSRLQQVTGEHLEAVRALEKRARLTDDKTQKASYFYRAAQLCEKHQLDLKRTEDNYVRAIEVDAGYVPALTALAEVYRSQGDFLRAAKLFGEASAATQNRLEKARFMVDSARLCQQADDLPQARALYEQVLKTDPEHTDAVAGMSDLYWHEERYEDALPLLEILTRKEADKALQVSRLCRLGHAATLSQQRDRAIKAYQAALNLDVTDLGALRGVIPLLVATGQFVDAQKLCQRALDTHREALPVGERVQLLAILGECEIKLQHGEAAREALREALRLDPHNAAALRAIIQLPGLDPIEHVDLRQSLLKVLLNQAATGATGGYTDERVRILGEMGEFLAKQLGKPEEAISAYREGLQLRPESQPLLHKLLDVYSQESRWAEAAEVLDTLIGLEKSEKRRARYRMTAALIARDELKDGRRALNHLYGALDDDATLERAREAMENIALTVDDPRELVRVYQRKIKALGPDAADTPKARAERLRLWTALSMLCIQRLGDLPTGAAAYEVTVALDDKNLDRRRQMAAIYAEMGGEHLDKAILEHQRLLQLNPGELDSYRALKDLYARSMQREKSAAVAYAMHILGKGDASDESIVNELRSRSLRPATRPLSKELWRLLAHSGEDTRLGTMFQLLREAALRGKAKSWTELGLNRKERLDITTAGGFCGKALRYAFEALDAPLPEFYARPDDPTLFEQSYRVSVATDGAGGAPVVCVELGSPMLSPRRPEREITYDAARLAAFLRTDRTLRLLYSTPGQLGLVLDAAIALCGDETAPLPPERLRATADGLRRALTPPILEQVRKVGLSLRDAGVQGEAAASSWLAYSDLTAVRAGLLLCGDLETVALLLATEPPGASPLLPKQRLLETLRFTTTEDYFTIRQHLGL
ncbi:MAG TPA: tetratricopeptide repeat protein [Pseudomonadota bacterium]|nr:tetratricopeptide repeat protein [Pseudomonadota bacterium]